MSVVKVHRLAVVGDNQAELEKALALLPATSLTLSPALRALSCGAPWMRVATTLW